MSNFLLFSYHLYRDAEVYLQFVIRTTDSSFNTNHAVTSGYQTAQLVGGVAKLVADGTIACSASNMWACLTNVLSWNIAEEDAVRAATYNPACALGVQDVVGSIETGKQADFIVCSEGYASKRVFLAGKEI